MTESGKHHESCGCPCCAPDAVEEVFTYHAPTDQQIAQLKEIRDKAKKLARVILHCAPQCPDRTAAIRKLREAVMTANASIVLKGASIR